MSHNINQAHLIEYKHQGSLTSVQANLQKNKNCLISLHLIQQDNLYKFLKDWMTGS